MAVRRLRTVPTTAGVVLSLAAVSKNTIQPDCHAVPEHEVPLVLGHKLTRAPRFIASLRAALSAETNSLAAARERLLRIMSVKLGTATASNTPRTATVTSSSTNVNPLVNLTFHLLFISERS
jgi:hypothetical protein